MANNVSIELGGHLEGKPGSPMYEYIKKEDIEAAFRDALNLALVEVLAKIDILTTLYANTAPPSLWTWNHTSRWDYDMWW
jgi:hypothetical protein